MASPNLAAPKIIIDPAVHTAQFVADAIGTGKVDVDAAIEVAKTGCWDMSNPAESAAILRFVPAAELGAVFAACVNREKSKAQKAAQQKTGMNISDAGRVVLHDLNPSGKGVSPNYSPAQLVALIDLLPAAAELLVNSAEKTVPATERKPIYNPVFDEGKKAGKSSDELRKAGVKMYVEGPHPRAGQSVADWNGCDKALTVAKLKAFALKNAAAAK